MDPNGNKKRAATELMCTIRNINRMIAGYKSKGKEYFIHGNRDRKPIQQFLKISFSLFLVHIVYIKYMV